MLPNKMFKINIGLPLLPLLLFNLILTFLYYNVKFILCYSYKSVKYLRKQNIHMFIVCENVLPLFPELYILSTIINSADTVW